MKTKNLLLPVLMFCMITFESNNSFSNNISVSNFSLTGQNTTDHFNMIKFDITWENSWRNDISGTGNAVPYNYDAAWIFIKFRIGSGNWQHTWLNNTGHMNPAGCKITTGLIDIASPFDPVINPGMGVFIYRDANGTGTFSKSGVQLRWNYGANGVADNATIDIRVYAIEMVYVPQGSFYLGDGSTTTGHFYKYPNTDAPYEVTSEDQIIVGNTTGNIYYGTGGGDHLGPIPVSFPKGYKDFYCMKYELTQQGYVDFLNTLTQAQANTRKRDITGLDEHRYAITGNTAGNYFTSNPYIACNHISWTDLAAYLDWSGLRPMTELEFEKSCRGPLPAIPFEFAWGTTTMAVGQYKLINMGSVNENIDSNFSTTVGNVSFASTNQANGSIDGPMRVGIFASNINNTNRISAGATYYGIMEMSGNVYEQAIWLGKPEGRAFTGNNGNGLLDSSGYADVLLWPGTNGNGANFRAGSWGAPGSSLYVSVRYGPTGNGTIRVNNIGGRGTRSVPLPLN